MSVELLSKRETKKLKYSKLGLTDWAALTRLAFFVILFLFFLFFYFVIIPNISATERGRELLLLLLL